MDFIEDGTGKYRLVRRLPGSKSGIVKREHEFPMRDEDAIQFEEAVELYKTGMIHSPFRNSPGNPSHIADSDLDDLFLFEEEGPVPHKQGSIFPIPSDTLKLIIMVLTFLFIASMFLFPDIWLIPSILGLLALYLSDVYKRMKKNE